MADYVSKIWAKGIFGKKSDRQKPPGNVLDNANHDFPHAAHRVVFVTGGAGSICSAQTRALVHLGANACIIGRSVEKTEKAAQEIAKVRQGAKVLGIGGVDVRSVRLLLGTQAHFVGC